MRIIKKKLLLILRTDIKWKIDDNESIYTKYLIRKCASEIFLKIYKEKHADFFIIDNGVLKAQDTHFLEHYGYHYRGNFLSRWSGGLIEKQSKLAVYGVLKAVKVNQM